MLIQLLLQIPITILNALTSWLPVVKTLPFGIDAPLVQGVGYLRFLITVFPPLGVMWDALLFVVGFKLSLKIIAMIPYIRGLLYK